MLSQLPFAVLLLLLLLVVVVVMLALSVDAAVPMQLLSAAPRHLSCMSVACHCS
jgi:hypothetical protein